MNAYRELGVRRSATAAEVRAAWRRAAAATHPDAAGGSAAAFRRAREAYELLSGPRRGRHERDLRDRAELRAAWGLVFLSAVFLFCVIFEPVLWDRSKRRRK